jgi:RNA polymerase sigma-70 factor (sigma-E family)
MGDKSAAFMEFAAARAGDLYRSACLLTGGDTHLAEDLVQDTMTKVYVRWRKVVGTDNPAAYVQTMLVHTYLSWRRLLRSGERPTGSLPQEPDAEDGDAALRLTLMAALARLAPQDRAVLVLRYWEDLSIAQTATALRLSEGAVSNRAARALARLRTELGSDFAFFADR